MISSHGITGPLLLTLDTLIAQLQAAKQKSPMGGLTCVYLCLRYSERDLIELEEAHLDTSGNDGGAIIELIGTLPEDHPQDAQPHRP